VDYEQKLKKEPKLRFPEFDDEWKPNKLGDIITQMQSGISRKLSDKDIGYPILRSNNLQDHKLDVSDIKYWYTNDNQGANLNNYILRQGDILVNFINSVAQIGKVALYENLLRRDTIFTTNLMRLAFRETVHTVFIFYHFLLKGYARHIHSITKPAVNQASFTTKDFQKYDLNLPTLPEQQKIAAFLSAVDKKIQQLTRKKELLQQYKKGVMQKIFSQEIRFKREDGSDYPDWEERQLSEFLIPTFREVPKPPEAYLAIGIRSHCRGTFQKPDSDPNAIAMDKLFVVKENDLIVNITFAWEGAIAMVRKEDDGGLVSHRFPTYTFNRNKVLNEFFKYVFVQKQFRYTLDLISPGGAGRNRVLSKNELLKIKWTMPLIEEQKRIASFLGIIDKKIEEVIIQLEQSQQFKKGLLQQMFV